MSLPHASRLLPELRSARRRAGSLLVGLDYDGTLTPIVEHPGDAHLPPEARAVLARLAARGDTDLAILSGRALADVRARVGVPGLYYAGNHGLELAGPGVERTHPGAAAVLPVLHAAAAELERELVDVPGALVEDKGASLTVHYRRVAPHRRAAVRDVALRTGRQLPGVRCTEGKMVVELRPDVDWDKGAALAFIRGSLPGGAASPAVFLGDDRTDEDAFRSLGADGWGVVIAPSPPGDTAARAFLPSPAEVIAFLVGLTMEPDS